MQLHTPAWDTYFWQQISHMWQLTETVGRNFIWDLSWSSPPSTLHSFALQNCLIKTYKCHITSQIIIVGSVYQISYGNPAYVLHKCSANMRPHFRANLEFSLLLWISWTYGYPNGSSHGDSVRRWMKSCISANEPPATRLTHWGRVTRICVGKITIIASVNGLSPERRQAIIWTNAGLLSIGTLRTYFSEILIKIQQFSLKKMHLKMSSAKRRLCCLGLNVLID